MNRIMRNNISRFFRTAYISPVINVSTDDQTQISYDDLKEYLKDYIQSSNLNPIIKEPIPDPDFPNAYIVAGPTDYGSAFILHLDGTVEFFYFNKLYDGNDSNMIKSFSCKVNDKKINYIFGSQECYFFHYIMAYELSNGYFQFYSYK